MEFNPLEALNIITGETGAGKSILIDALSLLLGNRLDSQFEGNVEAKCILEGEFTISSNTEILKLFEEIDIDFEENIILRREISKQGKSRFFINDTPANASQVKMIATHLVNLHSQHENLGISDRDYLFNILDKSIGISKEVEEYRKDYQDFIKLTKQLKEKEEAYLKQIKEREYLQFLLNEFEGLQLKENEETELENIIALLSNAEQIEQTALFVQGKIAHSDYGILSGFAEIRNKLKQLADINQTWKDLYDRINTISIELKDIENEIQYQAEKIDFSTSRLNEVNERLQIIRQLMRKHQVSEYDALLKEEANIHAKLLSIEDTEAEVEKLKKDASDWKERILKKAIIISNKRSKNAPNLEGSILELLGQLELPDAKIKFEIATHEDINEYGIDDIAMLFSANKGVLPKVVSKVASGGELSRLALCLKYIEAKYDSIPTIIFDEIDTGVSGKVAARIGAMFEKIAEHVQVIAITHLPQVASCGNAHFSVTKVTGKDSVNTKLKKLSKEERIDEIAAMLSGSKGGEKARNNAIELLGA